MSNSSTCSWHHTSVSKSKLDLSLQQVIVCLESNYSRARRRMVFRTHLCQSLCAWLGLRSLSCTRLWRNRQLSCCEVSVSSWIYRIDMVPDNQPARQWSQSCPRPVQRLLFFYILALHAPSRDYLCQDSQEIAARLSRMQVQSNTLCRKSTHTQPLGR